MILRLANLVFNHFRIFRHLVRHPIDLVDTIYRRRSCRVEARRPRQSPRQSTGLHAVEWPLSSSLSSPLAVCTVSKKLFFTSSCLMENMRLTTILWRAGLEAATCWCEDVKIKFSSLNFSHGSKEENFCCTSDNVLFRPGCWTVLGWQEVSFSAWCCRMDRYVKIYLLDESQ